MARSRATRTGPTRRDYLKSGDADVGSGFLTGCAGGDGPEPTPTAAETDTETPPDPETSAGS